MKKIKLFTALMVIVTITSSILYSCTNDEAKTSENATISKITVIDSTLNKNYNDTDILSNFLFDDVPANEFITINNIDRESFNSLINEKLDAMNTESSSKSTQKKLSCEEIRDAMVSECENGYCCGLDDACSIAVKIAYHVQVFRGKC